MSEQAIPLPPLDPGAGASGTARGDGDMRGVLSIAPFRRLWITLGLSSLGDWLGLLATTAMAGELASGSYAGANFAIAGVLLLRLLPAAVVGPLGGYIADRLDRRWTLVVGDVLRFALFASIPIVGNLAWLYVATLLIEAVSLVWLPAKDAAVPNLVPRRRLQAANQLSLVTTYGSALPAAGLFVLLALVNEGLTATFGWFASPVDLAMYVNAVTFLVGALVVARLREVSGQPRDGSTKHDSLIRSLVDGWRFVGRTPVVRGLVIGIVGAFATGGVVIGLGRTYVSDLGAGDAGYGMLFGALFLGLALGMLVGPRLLSGLSRRRMFGLALTCAGISLIGVALVPEVSLAALLTVLLGTFSGIAWVTGYTLLGLEVDDSIRGRTFAFVQSMTRVALVVVLAAAPAVAGAIGPHAFDLPGGRELRYNGAAITILLSAFIATAAGLVAFRQMDDRRGIPLRRDLRAAVTGAARGVYADRGLFVAFEGGEGTGKTTQASMLAEWLTDQAYDVVLTFEPGATEVGREVRQLLLHSSHALAPRAEALLFAADRAEHVDRVVRPALDRGAVVITDRYVDSSVAYQSAGRDLAEAEIRELSSWATGGLRPHLTVLLDLPAETGLERMSGEADRLERESVEFHRAVRQRFLDVASLDPDRYLVLDASQPLSELAARVRSRVEPLLSGVRPRAGSGPVGKAGSGGAGESSDVSEESA